MVIGVLLLGGITKNNILIIHQKNFIFRFVQFSHLATFLIFLFIVLIGTMGKEIGRFSNITTPTLKKPVLSYSAAHTLYVSNST